MGKPLYVCTSCGEHFTRHTSAKRHNFNIHSNTGYIVTWAEYVAGKATNSRYQATSTTYSPRRRFQQNATTPATTTVADSMGDTFRSVDVQIPQHQQQPYQTYPQQQHQTPRIITPSPPSSPPPQDNRPNSMSQYLALREQLLDQPQPLPQPRPESYPHQPQRMLQSPPAEKKNSIPYQLKRYSSWLS